jgi:GrpB-like predicted nucleotidyltransferase (UPF0157 family)
MPSPIDEPVTLAVYDPDWPRQFEQERDLIVGALGESTAAVDHIGSTAVRGLTAKPIVDILIGIDRPAQDGAVRAALLALRYEDLGEAGVPDRLYFRKRDPGRNYNAHVVQFGGDHWQNNLLLRDYLRTHPNEASHYQSVKTMAAHIAGDSLIEYSRLKETFVSELLQRARRSPRPPSPANTPDLDV